jgi:hypothetical protein
MRFANWAPPMLFIQRFAGGLVGSPTVVSRFTRISMAACGSS